MSRIFGSSGIFLVLASIATLPSAALAVDDVETLIGVIASPDATWEDRARAEKDLGRFPQEAVLSTLVPAMRDHPDGPKYVEPENAEGDKDAPPAWLAYFAGRRVWRKQIADLAYTPEAASFAADLLALAKSGDARVLAADVVAEHWSPRAEESLANWLRDPRQPAGTRTAAARSLYRHLRQRYEREIIGVADAGSPEFQEGVFFMITDALPPWPDPVVIQIGYRLLDRSEEGSGIAALIADRVGAYVGHRFLADPGEKETADQRRQREQDAVRKARDWWKANGQRIQRETDKYRPKDV